MFIVAPGSGGNFTDTVFPVSTENFSIVPHLDDVAEIVRSASRMALFWYRDLDRMGQVENKRAGDGESGFDPVTEADRAVEKRLSDALATRFPGHSIVGEEFGTTGGGRYQWTIDPIDGTRGFIVGQPMWGTLVGFSDDGVATAGWMHLPVLDETYVGHGGVTRFMSHEGSRRTSTSSVSSLADAVLLCTHPGMFSGSEAERFRAVAGKSKMVRYSGDCLNYGLVATGLADVVVENQLQPYDIIPLIPIVESAGGVVTNLDGDSPTDGGFVVASATEELHAEVLSLLKPSSPD